MFPLGFVPRSDRLWVVLALLVVTLGLMLVVARLGKPMRAAGGPDIVPFELAEDDREVRRILSRWGPLGRAGARRQTYVDFAFLVAYGATLTMVATYLGGRASTAGLGPLHAAAAWFAWLAVAAAASDAVEDVALLHHLAHAAAPSRTMVRVSHHTAQLKFALLTLCGLFIPVGVGVLNLA